MQRNSQDFEHVTMAFGEALRPGTVIRVAAVTPYCRAVPAEDNSVCLIWWTQSMPQRGFDAGTGWVGMTKPAEFHCPQEVRQARDLRARASDDAAEPRRRMFLAYPVQGRRHIPP
jgi:hypothetical protein